MFLVRDGKPFEKDCVFPLWEEPLFIFVLGTMAATTNGTAGEIAIFGAERPVNG